MLRGSAIAEKAPRTVHSGRQIRVHTGFDPDSAADHAALQFGPDPLFLRGAVYRAVSHATALVFPSDVAPPPT